MAIGDMAGERVYHESDILREFLGHNFASGVHTLTPPQKKKTLKH